MLDLKEMAVPLVGENPAGEDLEYDPLYMQLESLAQDVPDSQMGDSVLEGRSADWKGLRKNCLELWKRTRDLRVAAYLVVAETAMEGLPGFASTFKLLNYLVENLWDEFYPRLDPADDYDPLERINILSMLSPDSDSINDPIMFILRFRDLRLVPSLSYTLRDFLVASGEIEGEEAPDINLIRAELLNVPAGDIQAQADLAEGARGDLDRLCEVMNGKMKNNSITLDALKREIGRLCAFYKNQLAQGGSAVPEAGSGAEAEVSSPGGAAPRAPSLAGSRVEALSMLRKGAEYFQKNEPSSPVPFLVNRALRIADMNFIDLLGEMITPDAVGRGKDVLGVKGE